MPVVDDLDPLDRGGSTRRRYWSERHGRGPRSEPVSGDQLRDLLFNVFDEFEDRGYLQEAFGYYCVDAGDVHGTAGRDPNAYLLRNSGGRLSGRTALTPPHTAMSTRSTTSWKLLRPRLARPGGRKIPLLRRLWMAL